MSKNALSTDMYAAMHVMFTIFYLNNNLIVWKYEDFIERNDIFEKILNATFSLQTFIFHSMQ